MLPHILQNGQFSFSILGLKTLHLSLFVLFIYLLNNLFDLNIKMLWVWKWDFLFDNVKSYRLLIFIYFLFLFAKQSKHELRKSK